MYRGSRLAASFLLFLTGSAATAIGLGVVPTLVGPGCMADRRARGRLRDRPLRRPVRHRPRPRVGPRPRDTHRRGRRRRSRSPSWSRSRLGANPFAGSTLPAQQALANGIGLVAWTLAMYLLLGISAGRIRFEGWRRRSAWWPTPLLRVAA